MVSGVRVQIAGSAAVDTDGALLMAVHATVRALACKLIDEGFGLVVGIGDERIGDSGVPCTFDWTVIETIVQAPDPAPGRLLGAEPRFFIVGSLAGFDRVPPRRKDVWAQCSSRSDVEVVASPPGWRMGGIIRQNQARRADILVAVGGGAGVEHLAQIYLEEGKRVIPINCAIRGLSGDGVGGSQHMHEIALGNEGVEFFQLRDGAGGAAARLAALRIDAACDPEAIAARTAELVRDLRPTIAFYVRLLAEDHDRYSAVERFFRRTVDPTVETLGFMPHEVGRGDPLAAFLNVEIFEGIHRAGLVVVDLTGNRPNCLMELGYALARERRLVLSAERGTQLAFDPDKLRVFFWDDEPIADEQLKYLDWARRFMTIPPIIA